MKYRNIFLVLFALLVLATTVFVCNGIIKDRQSTVPPFENGHGLFSWGKNVLENGEAISLFETMNDQGLSILYQYFSEDVSLETVRSFLVEADKHNIRVYYLTGAPEWALDQKGKCMLEAVAHAKKINRKLPTGAKLTGIMMDTEPYLLDGWEEGKNAVMETYLAAMSAAHAEASRAGMRYAACIPFYYDNMGLEEYLGSLFTNGCDDVAIMNYSRHGEDKHIETEVALAREAGCPVTVIYELQEPGEHGLTESNTYYYEGMDSLKESFRLLDTYFEEAGLQYALHDYEALQEMLHE